MLFVFILLSLVVCYWGGLEFLRYQWETIKSPALSDAPYTIYNSRKNPEAEGVRISVMVVVRNEAHNLPWLFQALLAQTLPTACFELHLIDDASEDNTLEIAELFKNRAPFPVHLHKLLKRPAGGSPKKAAIHQVLPHTQAEIIAVTDGDCQPDKEWLSSILQCWQEGALVFLSGPVAYTEGQRLFEKMQVLDFAALIGVGASMLSAGRPGMCNAANMAFSKKAFLAVGGYNGNAHVPSGDDEFLLQKLAVKYPDQLQFMKAEGAVVRTRACQHWREFLHQRRRWAGKWRLHRGWSTKMVAAGLFFFYLLLFSAYLLAALAPTLAPLILLALLLKAVADFRFLNPVLKFLKNSLSLKVFILMELIYPFYVLFFAAAAHLGSFNWKGRSYRYSTSAHE